MKTRISGSAARHKSGYNCAQSVACTYSDIVGVDESVIFKALEAMGSGMGSMEGSCGAATGACMILGLKNSAGNIDSPTQTKAATAKLAREFSKRFIDENGAIVCKELKGVGKGTPLRTCPECIESACRILEAMLDEME